MIKLQTNATIANNVFAFYVGRTAIMTGFAA